jgi:hypothetical protein
VVVLAGAVVALAPAAPAQAHPTGIQVAVDYRIRVGAITPAVAGVTARYIADGSRLELRNDSRRTIDILGYLGEPMYQVRPDGVWKNTRAPSLYVDKKGVVVNADDVLLAPQWQRISTRPLARWQDHRALWHGNPPPAVLADPTRVHRVSNWRVPLRDGTTTMEITGTLDWLPPPDPGGWWATMLLVAATLAALGLIVSTVPDSRARTVRAVLAGTAVIVSLAMAGYPLLVAADNAQPSASSLAGAIASQAVPILLGLALTAAGILVLARRDLGDFGLTFAGICAVLFIGAPNVALFSHPVAPITADGQWARLAIATVLSGGTGLATAGALRMRRSSRPSRAAILKPDQQSA